MFDQNKKNLRLIFALLICILFSLPSTLTQNNFENGIWEQVGYGRIVEMTDKKITLYDICQVSCSPTQVLPRKYLSFFGKIISADEKTMALKGGINVYHFNRLQAMPDLCSAKIKKQKKRDPIFNFESMWHTFNEQYCAFGKRNIDWKEVYETYRPRIKTDMSDIDFYMVMEEMLNSMDDGHVWIGLPESLEKEYEARNGTSSDLPDGVTNEEYRKLRKDVRWDIRDLYIPNFKQYHHGVLRWGMTRDKVAYLQINAMEYMANYPMDETLEANAYFEDYARKQDKSLAPFKELVDGVEFIMDSILRDMQGAEAYILDIRFNGGGTDEVSLEIMNRFAKEKTKVFSKKARLGDGYTTDNDVYVVPAENTFTSGPIYVLTSTQTASAAEIMTMCAYAMPNVTIVGSHTQGIFSDILDKQLPNGWGYGVSNEVYETIDGKDWESVGIPPDQSFDYDRNAYRFFKSLMDGLSDGDDAIEWCLNQQKK